MDFQTAYGPKTRKPQDYRDVEVITKQAHKDECDVNNIIKKYDRTGILTHLSKMEGTYGDLTGMDFQIANDMVAEAKTMFEALPSQVRKHFKNDPALFLDFADDPANREKMVDMGLATRREVEKLENDVKKSERNDKPQPKGPEE